VKPGKPVTWWQAFFVLSCAVLAQGGWVPATPKPPTPARWLPGPFQKSAQPVLGAAQSAAVVKVQERYRMLHRGASSPELFLAESLDGTRFDCYPQPVFGGTEWYDQDGVDDPSLVFVKDTYYLTYTGRAGHLARLCLATSPDLRRWKKLGPVFPQFPTNARRRFPENWTRCAAILPQKLGPGPYRGRYLMVFGDSDLWLAASDDMRSWNYRPEPLLRVRPGRGDSEALQAGPALIPCRDGGLLLVYNGGDRENRWATYAALLDQADPTVVLARTETPIVEPTLGWEGGGALGSALLLDGSYWNLYFTGGGKAVGLARAGFQSTSP
jgi:predicted GH43/DUF377 family glycosyl hydrolase